MRTSAVAILGMHRSGTSALAQALHLAGVYLGDPSDLLGPNSFNSEGYWEHDRIAKANMRIMRAFGMDWQRTARLPENWSEYPLVGDLPGQVREILASIFGDASIWGWKDPRTSLLLPIYKEALSTTGAELHCCIAVRSPGAVADSLKRRDNLPVERASGLWIHYNLASLYYSVGFKRSIVMYDDLVREPSATLSRISRYLPEALATNISKGAEAVKPALNHSSYEGDTLLAKSDLLAETWSLCRAAYEDQDGLNEGVFDERIRRLWDTWNLRSELRAWETHQSVSLVALTRKEQRFVETRIITADRKWHSMLLPLSGVSSGQVLLNFGRSPGVIFARNCEFVGADGSRIPTNLYQGRDAFVDPADSSVRICMHGPLEHAFVVVPKLDQGWTLRFEYFADVSGDAAAEAVRRLSAEMGPLKERVRLVLGS